MFSAMRSDWKAGETGHIAEHNEIARRLVNVSDFASLSDAVKALPNGGRVVLPPGRFVFDKLALPANVSLLGSGATMTQLVGNSIAFTACPRFQRFEDFTFTHAGAGDMVAAPYGMTQCVWSGILFAGGSLTRNGLTLQSRNPDTQAANNTYFNRFDNLMFWAEKEVDGIGLYFQGDDREGVNQNIVNGGWYGGWATAMKVVGAGNTFIGMELPPVSRAGVHIADSYLSVGNVFLNCHWDAAPWPVGKMMLLENDREAAFPYAAMAQLFGGLGIYAASDITLAGKHPEQIKATIN